MTISDKDFVTDILLTLKQYDMSFCKGGFDKARHFMNQITDILSATINEVTLITGKIKEIEGNPVAQQIIAIIGGSKYEAAFNKAIDEIVPALSVVEGVALKIEKWLQDQSERSKNAILAKLASTVVGITDGNKNKESFYDTATQVHIENLK